MTASETISEDAEQILRFGGVDATTDCPWETVEASRAGLAADLPARLDALLDGDQLPAPHAVLVARDGKLVYEWYGSGDDLSWGIPHGMVRFDATTRHDLRSITKSVVALLYGIARDAGLVPDPEQPLASWFPEYPQLSEDPARAKLTVAHALTMTLALEWDETAPYDSVANSEVAMELSGDRCGYVFARPLAGPPGESWSYCGGATVVLARLIEKGAGVTLPEFARTRLLEPLGIPGFEWLAGPDAVVGAASGLRLTPRQLARIGQLILSRGVWQVRSVVPADWLIESFRPRVRTAWGPEYGYHWYLTGEGEDRVWAANGLGGQHLAFYPDRDLIIVTTGGGYDDPEAWRLPLTVHEAVQQAL